MKIVEKKEGSNLTLEISGSLDTVTAPELEQYLKNNTSGVTKLIFDFAGLEYVSSAGLRIILEADKKMNQLGGLSICNVNDDVMEVFEMTGFNDILNFI